MENYERTPYAGWCPTQLLPWIQNQDLKILIAFGIGMILIAGKLAKIITDFCFDFLKFSLLLRGTAFLMARIKAGCDVMSLNQARTADVQDTGTSTPKPMSKFFFYICYILKYKKLPCVIW